MPAERRKPRPWKPQPRVAPISSVSGPDAPVERQTMTQPSKSSRNTPRQNLKLSDWLSIFAFIDAHPTLSQTEIVKHFATLASGALVFTQSTLSRKLQERAELERRAYENPLALDSRRPLAVTRPDVERALSLWVKHMEEKGEQVDGSVLKEKRRTFERLFDAPEELEEAPRIRVPPRYHDTIPQLAAAEEEIAKGIAELQARGLIVGTPLTVDEFIEPKEDLEFDPDAMSDEAIVARVVREMAGQNGEVIDVESEDDSDESGTPGPDISRGEVMHLCERLEEACLQHGDASSSGLVLGLLSHLRRFRGFLRRKELSQQTTLDNFFTPQSHQSSEPST